MKDKNMISGNCEIHQKSEVKQYTHFNEIEKRKNYFK